MATIEEAAAAASGNQHESTRGYLLAVFLTDRPDARYGVFVERPHEGPALLIPSSDLRQEFGPDRRVASSDLGLEFGPDRRVPSSDLRLEFGPDRRKSIAGFHSELQNLRLDFGHSLRQIPQFPHMLFEDRHSLFQRSSLHVTTPRSRRVLD
jgi:hypothetical protein